MTKVIFLNSCALLYLKDLLPGHLDAAVSRLWLLLRKLLPEDLQLLHQVSFVLGDGETLGVIGQISRRQHRLGLLFQLTHTAAHAPHTEAQDPG